MGMFPLRQKRIAVFLAEWELNSVVANTITLLTERGGPALLSRVLRAAQDFARLLHFINGPFDVLGGVGRKTRHVVADQVSRVHHFGLLILGGRNVVLVFNLLRLGHHLALLLDRLIQLLDRLAQCFQGIVRLSEQPRHFAHHIARFPFIAHCAQNFCRLQFLDCRFQRRQ